MSLPSLFLEPTYPRNEELRACDMVDGAVGPGPFTNIAMMLTFMFS